LRDTRNGQIAVLLVCNVPNMNNTAWKPWPLNIIYRQQTTFTLFDLQDLNVIDITQNVATKYVTQSDTLYMIDGHSSVPLMSSCISIFLSSPISADYKDYVKQTKARVWCMPVWSFEELDTCRRQCFVGLDMASNEYDLECIIN
jgi:hypothetical protein